MGRARELPITGITRNGLVTSYESRLENLLSSGCQIRFVITDPDSDAIGLAADREVGTAGPQPMSEASCLPYLPGILALAVTGQWPRYKTWRLIRLGWSGQGV